MEEIRTVSQEEAVLFSKKVSYHLRREGKNRQKLFGGDVFPGGKEKRHSITDEINSTGKTVRKRDGESVGGIWSL